MHSERAIKKKKLKKIKSTNDFPEILFHDTALPIPESDTNNCMVRRSVSEGLSGGISL